MKHIHTDFNLITKQFLTFTETTSSTVLYKLSDCPLTCTVYVHIYAKETSHYNVTIHLSGRERRRTASLRNHLHKKIFFAFHFRILVCNGTRIGSSSLIFYSFLQVFEFFVLGQNFELFLNLKKFLKFLILDKILRNFDPGQNFKFF